MCSELCCLHFQSILNLIFFYFKIVWVLRCTCRFELLEILLWLYLYLTHSYQKVTILKWSKHLLHLQNASCWTCWYVDHDNFDNKVDSWMWIRFDHSDSKAILWDYSFNEETFLQSLLYKTCPILCTTVIRMPDNSARGQLGPSQLGP